MAKKTIPVPENYVERFKELVSLDSKLYDLRQEHGIKASQVWSDFEKEFDLRGKILKFDRDKFIITVEENNDELDRQMMEKIRGGKAQPYNQQPVVLSQKEMGKALPQVFGKKPSLWQRFKNSFK